MLKFCKKIIYVYLLLTTLFTFSMVLIHLIPKTYISQNIINSCNVLEEEGVYKNLFDSYFYKLDNFTDSYMLNIAASADSDKPVESAMMNYKVSFDNDSLIAGTSKIAQVGNDVFEKETYGRYWHGYQVFLRPILTFLDYGGIRILNYILLSFLVIACFVLIKKYISFGVGVIFIISLLLMNFPMVPMSMQFSTCFYISFISIILILGIKKITETPVNLYLTFFVIGACTSFFDLLTTPQVTLGLPLIFYCLKYKRNNWKTILLVCISWGLGYSVLWASKWLMVYILTEYNIFENAVNAVQIRSSNSLGNKDISIFDFLLRNKPFLLASIMYLLFLIGCIISLSLKRTRKLLLENSSLVLISLIVPAWYIFMLNHSVEHCWFTWRASIVTLLSILLFIYNVIKNNKLYGK